MVVGDIKQLPLGMWLREAANFENFLTSLFNQPLLASLKNAEEPFVFLWGGASTGKSHLLQAACHAITARGGNSVYLPMSEVDQFAPEMLEGLEQMPLVAIDDVDIIAGDRDWETALFSLYNRIRDSGNNRLLVAANKPLLEIGWLLPDLQSRLSWGLVYQVQAMNDNEKRLALQQRADHRGFELPDDVANYLLRHYQRQPSALFELLDMLDQYSLAEQRRLTIPFVKQIIET